MPIQTVSSNGGPFIPLLPNPDDTGYMGYGSLSPDGTKIAYLYYPASGISQLRVATRDGSSDVVIAATDLSAPNPSAWQNVAWGNSYIAVNCSGIDNVAGLNVGIRFFDTAGNPPPTGVIPYVDKTWTNTNLSEDLPNTYEYPNGNNGTNMSWSLQGRYLFTDTSRRMNTSNNTAQCIVRIDTHDTLGHDLQVIASPPEPGPINGQIDYMWPVLSPDGTQLVVTRRFVPWSGGSYTYSLVLMGSDGSNVTDLVADIAYAIWSPDGTKVCGANTGGTFDFHAPVVYDISANTVKLVNTLGTGSGFGWTPVTFPHPVDSPPNVPHPTPLTNKVWFFDSSTDNLIHTMNSDGTGNTLRDTQVAPHHTWIGGGTYPWWAISPAGDYAYFVDTDHSTQFRLYKSWNDSTHYRLLYDFNSGIYNFSHFQLSWDETMLLAEYGNSSTFIGGVITMGPNGENPHRVDFPAVNWQLFAGQDACQAMSPDKTQALVWNANNDHSGKVDLTTGAITDLGVKPWTAPAWSSQNKIAYLDAPNVVVIDGTTFAVEHTFSLTPAGSLNYVCMWNPAGTELILDDNAGTVKRYLPDGTFLNTLATYPSWPIGWS